ncbi:hypothetical protein HN51_058625 [Arachis hypogaea]
MERINNLTVSLEHPLSPPALYPRSYHTHHRHPQQTLPKDTCDIFTVSKAVIFNFSSSTIVPCSLQTIPLLDIKFSSSSPQFIRVWVVSINPLFRGSKRKGKPWKEVGEGVNWSLLSEVMRIWIFSESCSSCKNWRQWPQGATRQQIEGGKGGLTVKEEVGYEELFNMDI